VSTNDFIHFQERPSDSPFIERVWCSSSTRAGTFLSMAASHCGIVFSRHRGTARATIRGPETKATLADCPSDGEWIGITFRLGAFLPHFPAGVLRDRQDVDLAGGTSRTFQLLGQAWEYPDFNNAESFVAKLAREGGIVRDPLIGAALHGEEKDRSRRTVQRHFLHATGMTYDTYRQIERARFAVRLLREGMSVLDATFQAGYFDQAHLTRSLRRFVGDTPTQARQGERQLSLLY
jgi:hypothetical protein